MERFSIPGTVTILSSKLNVSDVSCLVVNYYEPNVAVIFQSSVCKHIIHERIG